MKTFEVEYTEAFNTFRDIAFTRLHHIVYILIYYYPPLSVYQRHMTVIFKSRTM